METVICSCLNCQAWIGNFQNIWDRIGKTYYSPVFITDELGGLVITGEVREAAKTGVIENCFLQDLACNSCGEVLGLRCDTVPTGHVLTTNQLILRIGGMTIVSEETGEQAILRVRRKYPLTGSQSPSINRQEGCEQPGSPARNTERDKYISRLSAHEIAASCKERDPLPGLIDFAEWAEDAIIAQRKDIDRISTTVTTIAEDMGSFKDFMIESRKDLLALPTGKPWISVKRSVTILEEEMDAIRKELEDRPGFASSNDVEIVKLSVEELDVLTSSITKISQKVSEVESLKIELQFMKTRLKRFEDAFRTAKQTVEPLMNESLMAEDMSSISSTPLHQRSTRGVVRPVTNENIPRFQPNSNLNRKSIQLAVPETNKERAHAATPVSNNRTRKRRSEEYDSDLALEVLPASSVNSQKRGKPLDPVSKTPQYESYWRTNHQPRRSLLSNVQHVDDTPDPFESPQPMSAAMFTDGPYSSENERRRPVTRTTEREYDSAPEPDPARQRARPEPLSSNTRNSPPSSPEYLPPGVPSSRPEAHQLKRRRRRTTYTARPRVRASPIARYDENGIRITLKGVPDKRMPQNFRFLQKYWEQRNAEKEGGGNGQKQENAEGFEDGERADIVPSIEDGTNSAAEEMKRKAREIDRRNADKKAELETRDRLVRETLEKEL